MCGAGGPHHLAGWGSPHREGSPTPPRLPYLQLMMEQSKKSSLMVARSILNNKLISKKLESYLKVRYGCLMQAPAASPVPGPAGPFSLTASVPFPQGENPFTDSPEEEKEQEEAEGSVLDEGAMVEPAGDTEGIESMPVQPPVPPELAPGAVSPPTAAARGR